MQFFEEFKRILKGPDDTPSVLFLKEVGSSVYCSVYELIGVVITKMSFECLDGKLKISENILDTGFYLLRVGTLSF